MRGLRATLEGGRGARRRGRPAATAAQRPAHGPARRSRLHLGGGHQLRSALRAAPGARRRARGHLDHRLGLGEKATGLGVGHFITTRLEFTDQHGDVVATMLLPDPQVQARHRAGDTAQPVAKPTDGPGDPARPSPRTTASSSTGPRSTSCSSSGAPRAAPSATPPPGLRQLPLLRVGPVRGLGAGHHLQLHRQPLSPGAGLRLPAGGGAGRVGGGHPPRGQRGRHHPRRRWPSACRWSPASRTSTTT